jgi:hypothetical protein
MAWRPSLGASLPSDMIDNDLPWLLAGRADVGIGALCRPVPCRPAREGALKTLSDKVGLCPLSLGACLELERDGTQLACTLLCATDDLLLATADGAREKPLAYGVCAPSSSCVSCPGCAATFLKVIIHSISSPA